MFTPAWNVVLGLLVVALGSAAQTSPPPPEFETVTIDSNVQIGYGVTTGDVDGDGKVDMLLADKSQIVWYQNPGWTKHVMVEDLTKPLDNVCLAARDLDGDGKVEVAVGAGWNPSDTVNSGALFYLRAPEHRTNRWTPVRLPHEPTIHRIRWLKTGPKTFALAALPLHGRGNKNGGGAGVQFLAYHPPTDLAGAWKTSVISDSLHLTHNFDLVKWTRQPADELLVVSREGIFHLMPQAEGKPWNVREIVASTNNPEFKGAGEVADGRTESGKPFVAAIEPMHGNQLVVYAPTQNAPEGPWTRQVVDTDLKEGHALLTGDFYKIGSDQIVMGWRAPNAEGKTGIRLYRNRGDLWEHTPLDERIACEDVTAADLDGDGRLDIVAAGRASKDLKVYWNRKPTQH